MISAKDLDYFNVICADAAYLAAKLPEPLPWIEPSINMLYLNAASSLVLGNFFCSIVATCTLLEHTLRLAVLDPVHTGLRREITVKQLDKYESISKLLKAQELQMEISKLIPIDADREWWKETAVTLRNKSAHYLLPVLLKRFATKAYLPEGFELTREDGSPIHELAHDWGAFFHRAGGFIAVRFFIEAAEQVKKLIANTDWKPDRSWWESQEWRYNSFFEFNWTVENMSLSLKKIISPSHKKE